MLCSLLFPFLNKFNEKTIGRINQTATQSGLFVNKNRLKGISRLVLHHFYPLFPVQNTTCRRERILNQYESAIRTGFVPGSFQKLTDTPGTRVYRRVSNGEART